MFEIRERDGLARIGLLETGHGRVATPTLAPVVNPNRPIIPPGDLATRFGAQILITNAYILGKSPARDSIVRDGIHAFLGFPGAVMTDSGAFQSHVYGDVDVTNAEVVGFQKAIRTDFGTMLDVFSEPDHDSTRAAKDVDETIRRAQEAVSLRGDMALVGAVQGGLHPDLRERCAKSVSSLDVAVCAIGGVVPLLEAYRFRDLVRVIVASKKGLDPSKPVHLFGAGHPLVFPIAALLGCDLFDSASYAKYARDGRMLFPDGTRRASELRESGCPCPVCTDHAMKEIAQDEALIAEQTCTPVSPLSARCVVPSRMGTCGSWSSVGPGLTQPCSSPCGSFVTTTSSWRSSSPSRGVALCTMWARRPPTGRSCIGSGDGSWNDTSRCRPRDLSCSQKTADPLRRPTLPRWRASWKPRTSTPSSSPSGVPFRSSSTTPGPWPTLGRRIRWTSNPSRPRRSFFVNGPQAPAIRSASCGKANPASTSFGPGPLGSGRWTGTPLGSARRRTINSAAARRTHFSSGQSPT